MALIYKYNESSCLHEEIGSLTDWYASGEPKSAFSHWINVDRAQKDDLDILTEKLKLHPLLVEDIFSKNPLPKFEMFEDLAFLKLEMVHRHEISRELLQERLSLICLDNLVISIQDMEQGDPFNHLRQKLKLNFKRLYKLGIDHLFLSLIDAVVDEYLWAIENFREPLENLETAMVRRPHINSIKRILALKSDLNRWRKITVPLRDELQRMRADAPRFIQKNNQVFYRDIIDHLGALYANFETFREMLRDLTELHNSNQNLMLGNTMKTLTVISVIFIPLTFIVGVYGMNVDFPEAKSPYAYYFIWAFMLSVAGGLIYYMKRKRWF